MWSFSSLWQRLHRLQLQLSWNLRGPYYTSCLNITHQHSFTQHWIFWLPCPGIHSNNPGKNRSPCQFLCSFMGYIIPPETHHVPHYCLPYNTILRCMLMDLSPWIILLEKRLTFPTTPSPSANVSIQSQIWSYTKTTPYWPISTPPYPLLPPSKTSTPITKP